MAGRFIWETYEQDEMTKDEMTKDEIDTPQPYRAAPSGITAFAPSFVGKTINRFFIKFKAIMSSLGRGGRRGIFC